MGHDYQRRHVRMPLDESIRRKDTERQEWLPVAITEAGTVKLIEYNGSAHVAALCKADGWISIDIGVTHLAKMAPVCVRLLGRIGD